MTESKPFELPKLPSLPKFDPPGIEFTGTRQGVNVRLQVRDCLEAMKHMATGSVDLVVTSPPYNLGIGYSTYKDNLTDDDYLDWSVHWIAEVYRILQPDGALFLNVGGSSKDPLMPHKLILRATELFTLQNTFHWIKSISIETTRKETISAGHFKPINSKRFVNDCHEFVFHLTKTGENEVQRRAIGVPYVHKSNIDRWGHTKGQDKRCRGNTWFIPYQTIMNRNSDRPHPATFPVQLAENCIRLHGEAEKTVMLDPFVGIGHAGIAAINCRVKRFIGFDIDHQYVREAATNLGLKYDLELESPGQ